MIRRLVRYRDTLVTTISANRYFSHHAYVDPYVRIEDVKKPGFFDECNRARPNNPGFKVMDRIECECADGLVVLRVMSVDEHNLSIETRPIYEPVIWAEEGEIDEEIKPEARKRGRPPKVAAVS